MRPFSPDYVPYNWRGLPGFRHWPNRQLGDAHGRTRACRTATRGSHQRGVYPQRWRKQYHCAAPRRRAVGLPRAAAPCRPLRSTITTRRGPATPRLTTCQAWRTRQILPPVNNLSDKGRPMGFRGGGPGGPPTGPRPSSPRPANAQPMGAGGPGVPVFLPPGGRGGGPVPGVLTGNGSVFIGTKGIMATSSRGEGVWLLPNARWQEYRLPPQLLTRSPWAHARLDPSLQRRRSLVFRLQHHGGLRRVAGLGRHLLASLRQAGSGTARTCGSPITPRPTSTSNPSSARVGN